MSQQQQVADQPVAMTVYFPVSGRDEEDLRALAHRRVIVYRNHPGMILKSIVFDAEQGIYGSHFLWESERAAQDFLAGDLLRQMTERFGVQPSVHILKVLAHTT